MEQNPVVVVNEYRAQQAKANRDYAKAVRYTSVARDAAISDGDNWSYCRNSYNMAHLQYALGRIDDCIRTLEDLVEHPAIAEYPELVAQARILLAHALQDNGASERAVDVAEYASNAVQDQSGQLRLKLQHSLISTLAEKGEVEAAWEEALVLNDLISCDMDSRASGIAYWSIGNAGFMSGRIEEGQKYHHKAAESLVAVGDVNLWALFNKAATNMRLEAGLIDNETLDSLERAEVAISVSDGNVADKLEIVLARAHWEYATGNHATAERLLRAVADQAKDLFPFIQAQAFQLLAGCLLRTGRTSEALKCARKSSRLFEESGASERMSQVKVMIDRILEDPGL